MLNNIQFLLNVIVRQDNNSFTYIFHLGIGDMSSIGCAELHPLVVPGSGDSVFKSCHNIT